MSHKRRQQEKKKYKKYLHNGYSQYYFARVIQLENGHIVKFYPYSANYNLKKYYKKLTNRKIRRKNEAFNKGSYKKVFDLWWTLY